MKFIPRSLLSKYWSALTITSVISTLLLLSISLPEQKVVPCSPPASEPESLKKLYDGVETFLLFIGYPASGHSIVGAILDAHPQIIIPHEYGLFENWDIYHDETGRKNGAQKYLLFFNLHSLSTFQSILGVRSRNPLDRTVGRSYPVPGAWQGKHNGRIKVIGDKKGGKASDMLAKDVTILKEIEHVVGVPVKFVHMVGNPFDMVATQVLKHLNLRWDVAHGKIKPVNNTFTLDQVLNDTFTRMKAVEQVRQLYRDSVLDTNHEVVLHPRKTFQKLCTFLRVTCSEDYFQRVQKILYAKPSVTRHTVVWTNKKKTKMQQEMKKYSFFHSFSFDQEF